MEDKAFCAGITRPGREGEGCGGEWRGRLKKGRSSGKVDGEPEWRSQIPIRTQDGGRDLVRIGNGRGSRFEIMEGRKAGTVSIGVPKF